MTANLNLSSELTPSRKRKRQFEKPQEQPEEIKTAAAPISCFTNAAFSSTPKKILARRRLHQNKENAHAAFAANVGLEVKSIADIAKDTTEPGQQIPLNPYEVLRKPPKKKKRPAEEAACFENPALNLELPEKQFNPYEIVREQTPLAKSNCFVNSALNLKTQDVPASRNPFEIQRDDTYKDASPAIPCNLKIGLPFAPNVGCRIDFKDMSMSQLTPSKLFAEKLVFSPVVKGNKLSLGSIGEETMDIGKELDCYQLELENSINEAKLRRNGGVDHLVISPIAKTLEMDVEKNIRVTHKLTEIKEDGETEEIIEETIDVIQQHTEMQVFYEPTKSVEETRESNTNPFQKSDILANEILNCVECSANKNPFADDDDDEDIVQSEDLDELYGEPDHENVDIEASCDDSFDFKAPAPFVRAYTRPTSPKLRVSKESLECKGGIEKPSAPDEPTRKSMTVKNLIRKSIRKLMHPQQHKAEETDGEEDKPENEKHSHGGMMNTIRQSLRRKPARTLLEEEPSVINECELSIIDGSERTMKLKSNMVQTEYAKIEDLTNEKKHNIRNSIRRSTREMGHHFMKSVFHKKHEEYEFSR